VSAESPQAVPLMPRGPGPEGDFSALKGPDSGDRACRSPRLRRVAVQDPLRSRLE
jgi:hypothetical protein